MTDTTLWAVHVQGPDDVIAAVDRAEADAKAKELNDDYETFKKRPTASEDDVRWHAVVIPWAFGAVEHAEEIARGDERWTG